MTKSVTQSFATSLAMHGAHSSSFYAKEYTVKHRGNEIPTLLKDFTREILRHQPTSEEFYQFAADHFDRILAEEQAALEPQGGTGLRHLPAEELEELLKTLFIDADVDQSGTLTLPELKQLLKDFDLGLPAKDARAIWSLVDVDGDGNITYEEFVPAAVDLIQAMYAREEITYEDEYEKDAAKEEAYNHLINGFSREQVEAIMTDAFRQADADNSGYLDASEFRACIRSADLGLTRKEINVLMAQADEDGDGNISYEEFVPVSFEILVEVLANDMLKSKKSEDAAAIEQYLQLIWAEEDLDGSGRLPPAKLTAKLIAADLGLTRVQTHSVIAGGQAGKDGMVDYRSLAPKAAKLIERLGSQEAQMERWEKMNALEDGDRVLGMGQEDFDATIKQAFYARDPDGTGVISLDDVRLAIESVGFSEYEASTLFSCACMYPSEDEAGMVEYMDFCANAWFVALYILQDEAIYGLD